MPSPVTPEEKREMLRLHRKEGLTIQQVADQLGRPVKTVQKNLKGQILSGAVTVIESDRDEIFTKGARFDITELVAGFVEQSWPAGLRFGIQENGCYKYATVRYEIVDDDGRVLQARRGATGHEWILR